jgi:carbon monoxide dehydrogenase subunit G
MEIREKFIVPAPVELVWNFFQDVEQVSQCVPGVESVTILEPGRYRVVANQKLGFFSVTFDVTTQLESLEPQKYMQYSSVGRTIKGAVGNLRSRDRVEFVALDDGTTEVHVICAPALGGMLGAVGHKMILSKSRELTEQFAQALSAHLQGHWKGMPAAGTPPEEGIGEASVTEEVPTS